MKKYTLFFALAIILLSFSCEEKHIPIELPEIGNKRVLMEEFSGGSCAPCAEAAVDIENLIDTYGENLIVVTMHFNGPGQSMPAPDSEYDLRTADGTSLIGYLGFPLGLPTAVIDRTLFDGEEDLQLENSSPWAGAIANAIQEELLADLELETTYDDASRTVNINATVKPLQDISKDVHLTVMITESGIPNKQYTPDGIEDDYINNHILKDVITPIEGENIGPLTNASDVNKSYSFTLPTADGSGPWKPEKCSIIAFISLNETDDKRVLQAAEKYVVQ